jgi:hypothetical protein
VNNWGHTYPYGGVLDSATGECSQLPEQPLPHEDFPGAGALTEDGGHYFAYRSWILDTTTKTWIGIPLLENDERLTAKTVVAAGDDLFVFGGANWPRPTRGELLADACIWSPRG